MESKKGSRERRDRIRYGKGKGHCRSYQLMLLWVAVLLVFARLKPSKKGTTNVPGVT